MPKSWVEQKHITSNFRMGIQNLLKAYCSQSTVENKSESGNIRFRNPSKSLEKTYCGFHKKLSNIISHKNSKVDYTTNTAKPKNLAFHGPADNLIPKHSSIKPMNVEESYGKIQKLYAYIQQLKEKIDSLTICKNKAMLNEEYYKMIVNLDLMYERYSKLSNNTLIQKGKERKAFQEYANGCQIYQKEISDSKEELSHQKMKMKLLHETLEKRSQNYNLIISQKQEIVIFNLILGKKIFTV